MNLLNRYVEEKKKLKAELSEIEKRQAEANKDKADVDEFIRRLKAYMKVPELTREMCMELIEFVMNIYAHSKRKVKRTSARLLDQIASGVQQKGFPNFSR